LGCSGNQGSPLAVRRGGDADLVAVRRQREHRVTVCVSRLGRRVAVVGIRRRVLN
jgi:hypothetical protein